MTQAATTRHYQPPPANTDTLRGGATTRFEAAKLLGIHVNSVDRMIKRGELAAVRYCSRTMIPITELERLLTPTPPVETRLTRAEAWEADHPAGE